MQAVYRDAILNKVSGFTADPRFRHILGQRSSSFSLFRPSMTATGSSSIWIRAGSGSRPPRWAVCS